MGMNKPKTTHKKEKRKNEPRTKQNREHPKPNPRKTSTLTRKQLQYKFTKYKDGFTQTWDTVGAGAIIPRRESLT